MLPDALRETLRLVWTTLGAADVPVAVMGGVALSRWERIRATKDIDLLAGIDPTNVDSVLQRLLEVGVRARHRPPIVPIGDAQFIHLLYEPPESFVEVRTDLLLASTAFLREALSRRVPMQLADLNLGLEVVSCEDLILLKLEAGRLIDRADAAELLWMNRETIDVGYVTKWIKHFRLGEEWAQIWEEAFPGQAPPSPTE